MSSSRSLGITSDVPSSGTDEWRCKRLLKVGVRPDRARVVARDSRYELHALFHLIDRGCDPELAVRILAPLEEDPEQC